MEGRSEGTSMFSPFLTGQRLLAFHVLFELLLLLRLNLLLSRLLELEFLAQVREELLLPIDRRLRHRADDTKLLLGFQLCDVRAQFPTFTGGKPAQRLQKQSRRVSWQRTQKLRQQIAERVFVRLGGVVARRCLRVLILGVVAVRKVERRLRHVWSKQRVAAFVVIHIRHGVFLCFSLSLSLSVV